MGLARPAVAGIDRGSYEKLRTMYNGLDIKGPQVVPAEEMEIAHLCKQHFCRCGKRRWLFCVFCLCLHLRIVDII